MPELPEVETIKRQLLDVLVGEKVVGISVLSQRSFIGNHDLIKGLIVKSVGRKSKLLIFEFADSDLMIVSHLKMTGQYVYLTDENRLVGGHPTMDWLGDLPSKHTRVMWEMNGGAKLFFNDMRLFGWQKLVTKNELDVQISSMPLDVVDSEFELDYFEKAIRSRNSPIKVVLTDQSILGGLGNIYANDALYEALISPYAKPRDLNDKQIRDLYESIKKVITLGIETGGASINDYVNAKGDTGSYQDYSLVYGKTGQNCVRCKTLIVREKLGGRSCFYCPGCQTQKTI
jgi:formamidopyrimidine-DNA glycosylase